MRYVRMSEEQSNYTKEPISEVIAIPSIPPSTTLKVVLTIGLSAERADKIPEINDPVKVKDIIPVLPR